jgi:hypothetical protein
MCMTRSIKSLKLYICRRIRKLLLCRTVASTYLVPQPVQQPGCTTPSSADHSTQKPLQLGLGRLETGQKYIPDFSRRLVEIEAHPLRAEVLAHDVELNPGTQNPNLSAQEPERDEDQVDLYFRRQGGNTHEFSLIIYAIPHPCSVTWLQP